MKLAGSRKNNCDYDESDEFFISKVFNLIFVNGRFCWCGWTNGLDERIGRAFNVWDVFISYSNIGFVFDWTIHALWAKVCMDSMWWFYDPRLFNTYGPWLFNTVSSRFFNLNSNQSIVKKTIPLLVARCGFFLHFFSIKPYGESIVKMYSIFFFPSLIIANCFLS